MPDCYSTENAVNVLPVYLGDYLRECGYKGITPQAIDGYLACIADMNRFNPVREYLEAGTWDGKDRFEEVYRILGVTTYRYKTYILKWFRKLLFCSHSSYGTVPCRRRCNTPTWSVPRRRERI